MIADRVYYRALRETLGLSQTVVGEGIGKHSSYVSMWENGYLQEHDESRFDMMVGDFFAERLQRMERQDGVYAANCVKLRTRLLIQTRLVEDSWDWRENARVIQHYCKLLLED